MNVITYNQTDILKKGISFFYMLLIECKKNYAKIVELLNFVNSKLTKYR